MAVPNVVLTAYPLRRLCARLSFRERALRRRDVVEWLEPRPLPPSASNIKIAKLLVASGAFDQSRGGETFWPPHGLVARLGSAPAYFAGHTSPSLKAGDTTENGSAT
jgi:hypothetical protein